ncbi:MAG: hypothetical protein ACJ790_01410, partial [Myxococcaceae bacterium]
MSTPESVQGRAVGPFDSAPANNTVRADNRFDLEREAKALSTASLPEVLGWIEKSFGATAALASSFSIEDVLIIHEA